MTEKKQVIKKPFLFTMAEWEEANETWGEKDQKKKFEWDFFLISYVLFFLLTSLRFLENCQFCDFFYVGS